MVAVLVSALVWDLLREVGLLNPQFVPSITTILGTALDELVAGTLARAARVTVQTWLIGLLLGFCIGATVGVAMGLSRWVRASLSPIVEFLRPMPSVALVPVAILMFGLGVKMAVALVAFASVWPVLFNTMYGLTHVEPLLLDVARTLRIRRDRVITKVMMRAALPSIFTGVRVAASIALILAVTAEIVGGTGQGIGFYISSASLAGNQPETFSGIFVAGIIGYVVNVGLRVLERQVPTGVKKE